jgi:hypothetical protein
MPSCHTCGSHKLQPTATDCSWPRVVRLPHSRLPKLREAARSAQIESGIRPQHSYLVSPCTHATRQSSHSVRVTTVCMLCCMHQAC